MTTATESDPGHDDDRVIVLLPQHEVMPQSKRDAPVLSADTSDQLEAVLGKNESHLSQQVQILRGILATLEKLSPKEIGSAGHQMLYDKLERGIKELSEGLLSVSSDLDEMTDSYRDLEEHRREPRICSNTGAIAHDDPLRIDLARLFGSAKHHIAAKSFIDGHIPSVRDTIDFESNDKYFASLVYVKVDILPHINVCDSEERGNDLLAMTSHCLRRSFGETAKIHRRGTKGLAFAIVAYGLEEKRAEQRILSAIGLLRAQCRGVFDIEPDIIYGICDTLSSFCHLGIVLDTRQMPPFPIEDSRLVTNLIEVTQRIARSRLDVKGVISYLIRLANLYRSNPNRFAYLSKWLLPNVIDIDDPLQVIKQLAKCRVNSHLQPQNVIVNEKVFLDQVMHQVSNRILGTLVHRCSDDIPGVHVNDLEYYAYSAACEEAIEWLNQ